MNVRLDTDTAVRGEYTLSRGRIVRLPDAPLHLVSLAGALDALLALEVPRDQDGAPAEGADEVALSYVRRYGFLTVPPTADSEPVADFLRAWAELDVATSVVRADSGFVGERPEPAAPELPEWTPAMERTVSGRITLAGPFSDQPRVLTGQAMRDYELNLAREEARAAARKRVPVDPVWAARERRKIRVAIFRERASSSWDSGARLTPDGVVFTLTPRTLLDALWVQYLSGAGGQTRTIEYRHCANPGCRELFAVDLTSRASMRQTTCSGRCRVALHRHRRASRPAKGSKSRRASK